MKKNLSLRANIIEITEQRLASTLPGAIPEKDKSSNDKTAKQDKQQITDNRIRPKPRHQIDIKEKKV
jgi:hypothetical protein